MSTNAISTAHKFLLAAATLILLLSAEDLGFHQSALAFDAGWGAMNTARLPLPVRKVEVLGFTGSTAAGLQPVDAAAGQPAPAPAYPFGNPAGCAASAPAGVTSADLLARVQADLGNSYDLSSRRQSYIWNGPQGTMLDVTRDDFAFEFQFDEFKSPLTYLGDRVATTFLVDGFTIWFRSYGGSFRLLAVPMLPGVLDSRWAPYVRSYWQVNGQPSDEHIYPVMKKLPCHWMIDAGYVSAETVRQMFNLDWRIPDYIASGSRYLAMNCHDANQTSQTVLGYWDAASMCGPLRGGLGGWLGSLTNVP